MTLLTKLRTTIHEQHLVHHGDTLVVGVSGGADSLTLLHVLKILAPDLELKLHVAHLNHQLRNSESDADEQFVVWLAREWGLPVANASWDVRGYAQENGLAIEEAARNLRYQFLMGVANGVNANAIAVAHNADDQVETILLHFLRGAGLSGLRGMAYKTQLQMAHDTQAEESKQQQAAESLQSAGPPHSSFDLIRPLLDVTRDEIEAYCAENNLQPRQDASNLDTTFLRNRLRHNVIPYLETINPNFREVVRHSALSITDDYAYIQQNVLGIFERMSRPLGDGAHPNGFVFERKWFRALPVNLQRGVLREAVSRTRRLKNISYQHIENARRVAADKDAGAEATLPQGLLLVVGYDDFTIGDHLRLPDAPLLLHGESLPLQAGNEMWLDECDWGMRVQRADAGQPSTNRWSVELDAGKIHGQLVLRPRRSGERFAPLGMGGKHKSLHEYMIDEKIPRHLRDSVPILADDEKVLWVVGYRVDERAAIHSAAGQAVSADQAASGETQAQAIIRVEFFKNLEM